MYPNSEIERVARHLINALQDCSRWPGYPYSDNARDDNGNLYMPLEDMEDIFQRALVKAIVYNETGN
jgi:hypothetical protein